MPRNVVLKYAIPAGISALLGCAAAPDILAAQSGDEAAQSETTSAPSGTQGNDAIDYEHAQPMPLPSVPGPAPAQTWPEAPATRGTPGHSEGSPGGEGTGDENARVLVSPKSSSQPNSDKDTGSTPENSKN